jgi:hypothetical protein
MGRFNQPYALRLFRRRTLPTDGSVVPPYGCGRGGFWEDLGYEWTQASELKSLGLP